MDNTHTEHNQQSAEYTKHAEKKPQTASRHTKQKSDLNLNMHKPSGIHTWQKIYVQP